MSDANLLLEKNAAVATITFNNPKALNALTEETFTGMEALLDELENDAEIRVIILTGAGDKAFIAGGDISHLASLDAEGARQFALLAQRVIGRIETFPKPVIAAVNGYCLGGGNELAMGCDLRIAADSAKFGQPEVKLGIIPGFAGTQRLSRLVGKGRAKEMIYTGEMIDAAEACRIGLVNRVAAPETLEAETMALAETVASKLSAAVKIGKQAFYDQITMPLDQAYVYAGNVMVENMLDRDTAEGGQVMDLLMQLEVEAAAAGGRVILTDLTDEALGAIDYDAGDALVERRGVVALHHRCERRQRFIVHCHRQGATGGGGCDQQCKQRCEQRR